ncbi:hypothetical protein MMC26_005597 [Xylographa opegraphella]|nr:hypothetical protein [Xylographa opegraphella]
MPLPPHSIPSCPFCAIAAAYPPSSSTSAPPSRATTTPTVTGSLPNPPLARVLLSTPYLVAFLDHAPISRGHVLIATRQHREKLSDVSVEEGRAVGAWIGILCRAVITSVLGKEQDMGGTKARGVETGAEEDAVGDWNVVQNNGARAAQVVPHVHFHIIPRPGDVPEIKNRSWTIFGKGQREELDDEDAEILIDGMRKQLAKEIERVRRREGDEGLRLLFGEQGLKREYKL